jgi:hypothetical protein
LKPALASQSVSVRAKIALLDLRRGLSSQNAERSAFWRIETEALCVPHQERINPSCHLLA